MDTICTFGLPGWLPFIGDGNGDNKTGNGVSKDGAWYEDTNGDGVFNTGIHEVKMTV